jgi:hypothetical protein
MIQYFLGILDFWTLFSFHSRRNSFTESLLNLHTIIHPHTQPLNNSAKTFPELSTHTFTPTVIPAIHSHTQRISHSPNHSPGIHSHTQWISHSPNHSTSYPLTHPKNQPLAQPFSSYPLSHPMNQPLTQPFYQLCTHTPNESATHPTIIPAIHWHTQWISHSPNHSPAIHSHTQWINHSPNHSTSYPLTHPMNQPLTYFVIHYLRLVHWFTNTSSYSFNSSHSPSNTKHKWNTLLIRIISVGF